MVGSALTLALIGLGAVSSALPAGENTSERRQTFGLGPAGSSFGTGSTQTTTPCLTGVPLNEQPPCIVTVLGGGLNPPKEKRFTLPPDAYTDTQHAIDTLELELEGLQNKEDKTSADFDEMADIKAALQYLAGITSISAPPGTGSTFHPGKRSDTDGACSGLDEAELAYESLMHKDDLSFREKRLKKHLASYLLSCGITIIKSPDGTTTTIGPSSKKRDVYTADFDLAGLEKAYEQLIQSIGAATPPFATQVVLRQIEAILMLYGITIEKSPDGTTTIITPDTTVPGGAITPSSKRRDVSDSSDLLSALQLLESEYGGYGSGTIPVPIFLIMENMVTVLQAVPVTVPGWPVLGAGSTGGIQPST